MHGRVGLAELERLEERGHVVVKGAQVADEVVLEVVGRAAVREGQRVRWARNNDPEGYGR